MIILTFHVKAQNPIMKVVSDTSCQSYIETPILVRDFDSVAAISMKIVFDTTRLTYLGYRNAHLAVSQNGNFIASTYQDRFIIGWYSLSPITIASDTLIVIRWQGTAGPPVRLWFDTTRGMCELVDFYGVRFNTQFIDGEVAPSIRVAPKLVSPPDTSGYSSTDVLFVYDESPCRSGPSIIQVSRDSTFPFDSSVSLFLMSPTFYRWFSIPFCGSPFGGGTAPENGPCWSASSGDSLIFWRVGSEYGSDTLWSDIRRISLSVTARVVSNSKASDAALYPNPVENYFCIRGSSSVDFIWKSASLYSLSGSLLSNIFVAESPGYDTDIIDYKKCYIMEHTLNRGYYIFSVRDRQGMIHFFPILKI